MPIYSYACDCGETQDLVREVSQRHDTVICKCGKEMYRDYTQGPTIRPDLDDFSSENGGRGRWNRQLNEYTRSVKHTMERAKARGFSVLDR